MAIADDFSVATTGDIRYTGSGTNYTVLELHRFLQDLADDAQASGDDLVDITTDTPSERATDQIVTLNSPFNIDDAAARHIYDGSIEQDDGDTLYSGLRILGTVATGTEVMIVQDHKVLPAYWGTGLNAAGADYVRIMIKTRVGGADIDGKRIRVMAREFEDTYAEFGVTLGLANSVAAVSSADDLNNNTAAATVRGWTTIANTEGFQLIDITGDTVDEEYYAQFTKGSQTLNDTYEWSKLQSARALVVASGTDTATDYTVDDATITGQAQSFTSNAVAEKLQEARFRVKVGAGTPTGPLTAELYATTAGVIPTGGVLATSEEVPAEIVTDRNSPTTYTEVIFRFNDNVTMTASTQYAIAIRHANGGAADYFEVEGAATGSVAGENKAQDSGGWAAQASADLWFTVKGTPVWHSQPGELFRGITHEIVYDNEAGGPFNESADEIIFWGTQITYDNLVSGPFTVGDYVEIRADGGAAGTSKNGGKVLKDNGTNTLWVALEDLTGNLADNDDIISVEGTATCKINGALPDANNDDTKQGGEGILLALDDNGTAGDVYLQVISGDAPADNQEIEGRTSGATADVNVTVTPRTISPEFIGTSTGSNLIGAYGIGFNTGDIGASDLFFDLGNSPRQPPNNVQFTVTGLVSGEDRVLVGPRSGSALNKAQLQTDTTLNAATETLVQCSTAIPSDTPTSGTGADNTRLRVELDTGVYRRVQYDSYSGNDFTITTGPDDDWTGSNVSTQPKDVFVAYIDVLADATTESYTAVYSTDRDILVRVRDGGATPIKTFEGEAVFGSTNSSVAAVRTSDA